MQPLPSAHGCPHAPQLWSSFATSVHTVAMQPASAPCEGRDTWSVGHRTVHTPKEHR